MTKARSSADYAAGGPSVAAKNFVINGGMDVWQRGTSFSFAASTLYASGFNADRWATQTGTNQATTVSRQATGDTTNLPNIQYCSRWQRNSGQTGTQTIGYYQSIETANSIPLAGRTVTYSFYARKGANYSATSSALTGVIYGGTGTDQNVYTYTGLTTVASSAVTLTTTWQRFTITATVGTSITEIAVGFEFTPTGTAGAADYFEITGVQLEVGSTATPFSRAGGTIQGELAACQRYYYRNAGGNVYSHIGFGTGINTTQVAYEQKLPVTMRVTPTSIEYSNVAVNLPGSGTTGVTGLVIIGAESSPDIVTLQATVASGLTAYRPYFLINNNNAAGYVGYVAEL